MVALGANVLLCGVAEKRATVNEGDRLLVSSGQTIVVVAGDHGVN